MEQITFELLAHRAKAIQSLDEDRSNYWSGFLKGLRRRYHGENFGTEAEHNLWLTASGDEIREQLSMGYRDGYHQEHEHEQEYKQSIEK